MYKSFTVRNFRCFRDLTIEPLARVNLIAGRNNVGKTALLEALCLAGFADNPEIPLVLDTFRGLPHRQLDPDELWGWLFLDRGTDDTIELSGVDARGGTHTVTVRLAEPVRARPVSVAGRVAEGGRDIPTMVSAARELAIEYLGPDGNVTQSRAFIARDEMQVERGLPLVRTRPVFLSTRVRAPGEDADRFSRLARYGRQEEVIEVLRHVEPRLVGVAVLTAGGIGALHADVGAGQLIPLQLAGEGLTRLLSLMVAIADAPGGVVLVDEIENGLHHSALESVWRAVGEATSLYNTQVFATTHSWECTVAAHEAFDADGRYDFALHRLDRVGDDVRVMTYSRDMLETALNSGLEVR